MLDVLITQNLEIMKKNYISFSGNGISGSLSKVVVVTFLIMVWILIDKGNASGQSSQNVHSKFRTTAESIDMTQAQFRNGDPSDEENGQGEEAGDLKVFPNPVKDDLVFDFEFTVRTDIPFEVTDALGRLMDQGTFVAGLKSHKLDFSKYRNGMYLVRVQLGGTSIVKRVIKS
jgi:hypothetical protein